MHGSFNVPVLTYRNPEFNDNRLADQLAAAEEFICNQVSEIAQKHYPGHPWNIQVDIRQKIIKIQLRPFMGPVDFYIIKASSAGNLFVLEKLVVKFCGEILERYGVPRCRYDGEQWREISKKIPAHRRFHGWIPN